jgi:hypothetical protein
MFGTSGTILLKKRHSVFYSAIFSSVLEPVDCETRVVCGCCHVYFFSLVFYCSSLIFLLITMLCGRCCGGDYHALLAQISVCKRRIYKLLFSVKSLLLESSRTLIVLCAKLWIHLQEAGPDEHPGPEPLSLGP